MHRLTDHDVSIVILDSLLVQQSSNNVQQGATGRVWGGEGGGGGGKGGGLENNKNTCLLPGWQDHPSAASWQQSLACLCYPLGRSRDPGWHAQSS